MVPRLHFGVVDVRDVAKAHITAMTSVKGPGREKCIPLNKFHPMNLLPIHLIPSYSCQPIFDDILFI